MSDKRNNIIGFHIILLLIGIGLNLNTFAQTEDIKHISKQILEEDEAEKKLILNAQLIKEIDSLLSSDHKKLLEIDSTGLLYNLISTDKKVQIITWAIIFDEKWEHYGFIKSYSESKKEYKIFELIPSDFHHSTYSKDTYNHDNWPAALYIKMVETSYNNKDYYTLLGWLPSQDQTAFKLIEVLTLSKSGKPSFGKLNFFMIEKEYHKRMLFSYNFQSKFQLDYGEYSYSNRKWNKKKKKYETETFSEELIVFDHLIPMYPDLADLPEFMVPMGNAVDAFYFEKGKWRMKADIDARNMEVKEVERGRPSLDLFESN